MTSFYDQTKIGGISFVNKGKMSYSSGESCFKNDVIVTVLRDSDIGVM